MNMTVYSYSRASKMILTIGNTKGGVGKTTLAIQIALARALAGHDPWLVDGDRQGTALMAIALWENFTQQPAIACSHTSTGPALRGSSAQAVEPRLGHHHRRGRTGFRQPARRPDALGCGAGALRPRSFDVWALAQIAGLIEEARSVRDGLVAYAVLNAADPAGSDNREAADALSGFPQLVLLDAPLGNRKAFATASGFGHSVAEMKPTDRKACAEVDSLVSRLFHSTAISHG